MARRAQDVYTEWRGGTCRVKWWTGEYHANGRKRFESKGGFTDEDEAYEHGLDQMADIRHGVHVSNRDGAILVTDWIDQWLSGLGHADTTEVAYRSRIENHIRPYFARKTVAEIDVIACRAFKKHVQASVKPVTAANILMLFGMILDDAVPNIIKTSPFERTRRRGKFVKKKRERKRDILPSAVEALACNARHVFGESGYAFIWTMAATGMRPGELFGLTREYCYPAWPASDPRADPEEETRYEEDLTRYGRGDKLMPALRVERQVQHMSKLQFFPPKYGSQRTLVIPPFLAEMLVRLQESHDSRWVFPAIKGGCLRSADFNMHYWKPTSNGIPAETEGGEAVLPAIPAFEGKRMYLLRHGHKAWLDEDGHSRFAVESRMGHEVPGVEGIYSSVTVAMEEAVMEKLQERWEKLQAGRG